MPDFVRPLARAAAAAFPCVLLAACVTPDAATTGSIGPGTSRLVEGSSPGVGFQRGAASWYQVGRRTASGEAFNPNGLTAAHRSLPFDTRVRVVNEAIGRSVVVRINDRGPFTRGRIIDLSRGSARALGVEGVSRVSLHRLD